MISKEKFMEKVKLVNGCWEWTGNIETRGYGIVNFKYKKYKAHRVSYEIFNEKIPSGNCYKDKINILHKCDNRKCVNPDHLFLGTFMDNHRDMILKGRENHPGLKGSKNSMAKINEETVLIIRSLNGKMSQSNIGKMFNLSQTTVGSILNKKTWTHI